MEQVPYRGATSIWRHSKHLFAIAVPSKGLVHPCLYYMQKLHFYLIENTDCMIKLISSSMCIFKNLGGVELENLIVSGDGIQMYY